MLRSDKMILALIPGLVFARARRYPSASFVFAYGAEARLGGIGAGFEPPNRETHAERQSKAQSARIW